MNIHEKVVKDWKQALKDKNKEKNILSIINTELKKYANGKVVVDLRK